MNQILIVDDSPTIRRMVKPSPSTWRAQACRRDARDIVMTAVTDAGGSVTAVASVEEPPGALREQNGERPQVVIADIGLPGADGCTFISELRRMPPDQGGLLP